jgi:hypothetical protein
MLKSMIDTFRLRQPEACSKNSAFETYVKGQAGANTSETYVKGQAGANTSETYVKGQHCRQEWLGTAYVKGQHCRQEWLG